MEFKYIEQVKRTIKLSMEDMREIAMEYIQQEFKVNSHMWIEDGNLMHEVEYITSHRWSDNEIVRPVADIDKAALKIIKNMHAKKYNLKDD